MRFTKASAGTASHPDFFCPAPLPSLPPGNDPGSTPWHLVCRSPDHSPRPGTPNPQQHTCCEVLQVAKLLCASVSPHIKEGDGVTKFTITGRGLGEWIYTKCLQQDGILHNVTLTLTLILTSQWQADSYFLLSQVKLVIKIALVPKGP